MPGRLLIDGIDQVKRVLCEMALIGFWLNPDGKEFGTQVTAASFIETDVPDVIRIGRADVEVLIEKALRGVGVGVDDDGGVVDGPGAGRDGCGSRRRGGPGSACSAHA